MLSEAEEIVFLNPYFGEDAIQGLYCVNIGSGLNVRECADTSCQASETLLYQECLYFDGRLRDSAWLRIAEEQELQRYADLAHKWVSTAGLNLIVRELRNLVNIPDMEPYFELLPIVTPAPTPRG